MIELKSVFLLTNDNSPEVLLVLSRYCDRSNPNKAYDSQVIYLSSNSSVSLVQKVFVSCPLRAVPCRELLVVGMLKPAGWRVYLP